MFRNDRKTARDAFQPKADPYSRETQGALIVIRRSTVINFLAILLILGAIFALHAVSKKYVFRGDAETAATVEKPAPAESSDNDEAAAKEIQGLPATALEDDDQSPEKTETAEAGPAGAAAEAKGVEIGPEAERPAEKRSAARTRRARASQASRNSRYDDRSYGVENLDNEQARRRYLESGKGAKAKHSTYTMPESQKRDFRSYAVDDLDGDAARKQYQKENKSLSSADLK